MQGKLMDGAGAAQQSGSSAWHEPWPPHREDISLNKFINGKDLDAAGAQVFLKPSSF